MGGWGRTASVRPQVFALRNSNLVQPVGGNRIRLKWDVFLAGEPACARPRPIGGQVNQASTHWIHVDVVDSRQNRGWLDQIPVVTSATLPKQTLDLFAAPAGDFRNPM